MSMGRRYRNDFRGLEAADLATGSMRSRTPPPRPGGLYGLCAWVVMANHVHVLLWPRAPLEKITRAVKGFTARQANKLLGRTGKRFWQEESYDHWIRREEEFQRISAYIESNPVSAGLVKKPEDWLWSSASK